MYFNITLTNVSPLLIYDPQVLWAAAPANDSFLSNYPNNSYRATDGSQGSGKVSFSWTGTGIWVYGGYRRRLGPYQVWLDRVPTNFSGYQPGDPETGDSMLFGRGDLSAIGTHTMELQNTGSGVLDIDYLVFESSVDSDGPPERVEDSQFRYSATDGGAWEVDSDVHRTDSATAAQLNFTVSAAIAVYGTLRGNGSAYTVYLDNNAQHTFQSNSQQSNSTELLYFANLPDSGNHSLTISNNPSSLAAPGGTLAIGYAVVYGESTTSNAPATNASTVPVPQRGSDNSKTVAVVLGTLVPAVAIVFAFWYIRFRIRGMARRRQEEALFSPRPFTGTRELPSLSWSDKSSREATLGRTPTRKASRATTTTEAGAASPQRSGGSGRTPARKTSRTTTESHSGGTSFVTTSGGAMTPAASLFTPAPPPAARLPGRSHRSRRRAHADEPPSQTVTPARSHDTLPRSVSTGYPASVPPRAARPVQASGSRRHRRPDGEAVVYTPVFPFPGPPATYIL